MADPSDPGPSDPGLSGPDLSDEGLLRLADLARLDLDPAELPGLRVELGKLLAYVDRLADVDDPAVPPLRHPNQEHGGIGLDALRPDEPRPGLPQAELEGLLPLQETRVRVPRTVERDGG